MTTGPTGSSGEDDLIARYFRPLARDPGAFGLIDDAAILAGGGEDIVVTTDAVVAGVHFLPDDPPDTIARKALRVNLSDLAAKGATPAGFVLTLGLPRVDASFLAPFARALGEDADRFGCPLLGGDTVATPGPLTLSITAFGRLPVGTMVRRSAGQAGDQVVVTGTIGDAALGLDVLRGGKVAAALADRSDLRDALVARYRVPEPRTAAAGAVRQFAHGAMDVSDGLAGDLTKLCAASGVSARIDVPAVPLSDAAREALARGAVTIQQLLSGGDDYEILCSVAPERCRELLGAMRGAGVAAIVIGELNAGAAPPAFVDAGGQPIVLPRLSYSHF